jgi:hypothetical protein
LKVEFYIKDIRNIKVCVEKQINGVAHETAFYEASRTE